MSKTYNQLSDYINWAMGLSFFVAAFLLSKDELVALIQNDTFSGALSIVLLLVTMGLFFLYAKAVRTELDLLDTVFVSENVQTNELSGNFFLAILAVATLGGFLIANVTNIAYYSGAAALYSMFDLFGVSLVIRNFNILLRQKNFRNKPLIEKEADVLFDYYVGKPLLTKIAVTLIFECIAFVLSIYSIIKGNELGSTIAYFIMITTIVIGEFTIYSWRKTRDNSLREIEEERKQHLLSERKEVLPQTKEALSETEDAPAATKG